LVNTFRREYLNCNLGYIVLGVVLVLREAEMGTPKLCRNLRVSRRTPVRIAVVVAVVSMLVGGCSRAPSAHSSPLPLQPVGEVALPGGGSRFDYASLDSARGLLFIAHLGASQVVEVDVHHRDVVVGSETVHRRAERGADLSMIAGDGIGLPRCAVINDTTCPATCRLGT
jgi:hypothetical protein